MYHRYEHFTLALAGIQSVKTIAMGDQTVRIYFLDSSVELLTMESDFSDPDSVGIRFEWRDKKHVFDMYMVVPFGFIFSHPLDIVGGNRKINLGPYLVTNDMADPLLIQLMKMEFKLFLKSEWRYSENSTRLIWVVSRWLVLLSQHFERRLKIEPNVDPTHAMIMSLETKWSADPRTTIPSIEEMAKEVNMSPSYFRLNFKKIFFTSPHRHFLLKKLQKSVELLLETDLSLAEIAQQVGFQDPSGISKLFRREFGMTPFEFRSRMHDESPKNRFWLD